MSKGHSGLFNGTKGSKNARIIPGKDGFVTGGDSSALGRNMLKEMDRLSSTTHHPRANVKSPRPPKDWHEPRRCK